MSHVIKIGRYEIIDAVLNVHNVDTVSIPCLTNLGLSYQLEWLGPRNQRARLD